MSELIIKEREICIPGDIIANGMDFLPANGTCREGENIVANKLGIVNVNKRLISIIPVSGKYLPKRGDTIIGKVFDVTMSGWRININCAYPAMLMVREATTEFIPRNQDLTKIYNIDDYVVAKIENVTSQNLIDLSMKGPGLKRLNGGRVIEVTPSKVPRIIGKQGSMVTMIKNATDSRIIVGQNGRVWVSAEEPKNEFIAVSAIKMIEENAHVSGLTDKVKEYLETSTGVKIEENNAKAKEEEAVEEESGEDNE